ncbi:efflux transporter, outer membrane factor lipoprotein, NodT family [Caulobacter sp. AP07]|uniref:efflux transporter outer membrane subunit n=1 Tax=Caulobacter sp. AP07 TaxID=1144304 RepID=UPI0002720755|nr:efflux transporter outer membrane subunit [Caulobacter sp. AP07]EJL25216.1 efflux transporter, outer membrane factor lipoprotein, NodT family [Caulobacter sp. AP07]
MRSVSSLALLALAGVTISGCAVGPNYVAPASPVSGAFIGAGAVAQRAAAPASIDQAAWWKGFNDPVLDALVDRGLAQNLDLAQAAARVTQARAGLTAATAALLPSGGVQASATSAHASTQTPAGRLAASAPGFDRDGSLYEADATAGWEIDVFGGLRRDREAAAADYQAARVGVAAARLSVAAQTADTYLVIRGLQARLAIAQGQVDTQARLVETVRLQQSRQVASELQLHQVEGALAQTRAQIPVLQEGMEAAMNALDVLLGAQPGATRAQLAAATPVPRAPAIAEAVGPADLIRRRPDLAVAEWRLKASNAAIGAAVSEYYPKFSLTGLVGTASTASGSLFTSPANQAQGVLGLRWRLFDFGRVNAEIKAAKGRNAEVLAAYQQSVLRATADVEDSFSSLVKREDEARILVGGEQSLSKARTASELAYKAGAVSLIEVLDADARLLAARDARAQADTEAARAAVRSFRALGGGWSQTTGS